MTANHSMQEQSAHYALIAEAIRFLRGHHQLQPELSELAAHLDMSESHCQRLFSDWVGVSPKRFIQYLTKEHAKSLLRQSRSVLEASLESGLSSPSRLHDLMVTCEAMTPGELKAKGKGMVIQFGIGLTPFGQALIAWTERGICSLAFIDGDPLAETQGLKTEWPDAEFIQDDQAATQWLTRIFSFSESNKPLHVLLKGTNFQVKVWEALLKVKSGQLVSYGKLADMAGQSKASRAVGSVMAANKIGFLIPCHRVIRESGDISHYRWAPERKAAMQIWESTSRDCSDS